MFGILLDIINFSGICFLAPFAYFEGKYCKYTLFMNKMLKNQIIRSGPIPIKIAQFIINFKNIECYDNKPAYLTVYNDLFNNVYKKNKIDKIKNYTLLNSGSICAVYLHNTDNTILKKLHYKSIDSLNFYLSLIKYLFYLFSIPLEYNDFKKIFVNQFSMEFESMMHMDFYNNVDNNLINIPKIINNNNTDIIMEYLPSQCINNTNLSFIKMTKYAQVLSIFFKHMFLDKGLIHIDLHDGNWGIIDDKIVIYDFGYSLKIFDPNDTVEKKLYEDLLFYFINEDLKESCNIIFSNFTTPVITDYSFMIDNNPEFDSDKILSTLIQFSIKKQFRLHINIFYLLYATGLQNCRYKYLFKENNTTFHEKQISKLQYENAIIYKNQFYNNVKMYNDKNISFIKSIQN